MASPVENYLERFKAIPQREFPLLQEKAMEHFSRLGFPSSKNEEWKYTNIAPILSRDFSFSIPENKIIKEEIVRRFPFVKDAVTVVLENGKINREASDLNNIPAGIEVKTLGEAKHLPEVQAHYNLYADVQADAFSALNTAFANDGLVLLIQPKAIIEKPVYIIQVSSSNEQAVISHHRLLVIAGKNSEVKISHLAVSKNEMSETFSNAIIEILLQNSSRQSQADDGEKLRPVHSKKKPG